MLAQTEQKILDFILNSWEFKSSPVRHPKEENLFLIGYTSEGREEALLLPLSPEEAKLAALQQIENFLNKELPAPLAKSVELSPFLEVLFSIRVYLGNSFFRSEIFKRLLQGQKLGFANFKDFLLLELNKIDYKVQQRLFSSSWAALRKKELAYLKGEF